MHRGNKGEKRDPGKLLREEKMRKRIAKELPKIEAVRQVCITGMNKTNMTQDLKKILEQWEDEYGRPFLVQGNRYLDELYSAASKAAPPRAKTPSNSSMPSKPAAAPKPTPVSRSGTVRGPPPSRAKTPVSSMSASISRNPLASSVASFAAPHLAQGARPRSRPVLHSRLCSMEANSPERRLAPPTREDSLMMMRKNASAHGTTAEDEGSFHASRTR